MISLILIWVASFLNAFMDALENENFGESIFKKWDKRFWYKRESWKWAKKIGGYHLDGWHLAKSLMIVTLCLSIVFYSQMFNWWIDFLIYGIVWNGSFVFFYHKIFKVK